MRTAERDVFINCAFDPAFAASFRALVFGVFACHFRVRCAREMDDGSETRLDKLYRIIEQSRFSVHDLSTTALDEQNGLPRFNMPFELGMFLATKKFGGEDQRDKRCLIFDQEEHRFRMFLSDISGMDVTPHGNDPRRMVSALRDWLVTVSRDQAIPSTVSILNSYDRFVEAFPEIAAGMGIVPDQMLYADLERVILSWAQNDTPNSQT